VLVQQRPPACVDHVRVTPVHDCHHDRIEIEPFLGENVFVPFGRLLIGNPAQHALPDQFLQPLREQMARDPERGLKSLEAARPQEAFAQDHEGPAVADHADGSGHRTWLFLKFIPSHSALQSSRAFGSATILDRYLTPDNPLPISAIKRKCLRFDSSFLELYERM
jgi:hypothetical protein